MSANGGVIGKFNNPTTTTAPGVWGMNAYARRQGQVNTYRAWPTAADPSFASVTLLCHFESMSGTATGDSFIESYPPFVIHTFCGLSSRVTGLSDTNSKFGQRSLASDGYATSGCIAATIGSNYQFGTGDYTVEGWYYPTNVSTAQTLFDFRPNTPTSLAPCLFMGATAKLGFYLNGGTRITGTTSVGINAWHHWAVSRVSGSTYLYLDGTQEGSTYADSNNYNVNPSTIALNCATDAGPTSQQVIGYVDEIRVTKGVGRYSGASCTVPTAPFPDY